ncbi:kinase-like domain-containing protein, partial [Ochromonadaceae sp. CCMP2298]
SFGVILYILLGGYPPFHDDDQKLLFRKIKAGVFEFHAEYWDPVSDQAKDLISRLLCMDPEQRLTAAQALAHPWMQCQDPGASLSGAQGNIKRFQANKR